MNNNSNNLLKKVISLLIMTSTILSCCACTQDKMDDKKVSKTDDKNESKKEAKNSQDNEDVYISEDEIDSQKLVSNYEKSSDYQNSEIGTYNTKDYYIVYIDGKPTLYYRDEDLNKLFDINYKDKSVFIDLKWDAPVYNEENIVSRDAVIPCQEIISFDTFTEETYEFLSDSEKLGDFIDGNYQYPLSHYDVVFRLAFHEDNDLGIFKFTNALTEKVEYHIGYQIRFDNDNAKTIPFVYDIKDNKNYRMPDIGSVEFIKIKDYWEEDSITANEAIEILDNYINDQKVTLNRTK